MSRTLRIDVGHFSTTAALHEGLAAALGFPGWYGMNWDAFADCIAFSDQSWIKGATLSIHNFEVLQRRLPRDARLLAECLAFEAGRDPEFVCRLEGPRE
jgi:RNAse (barnase) inhibitor barstar